MLNKNELEYLYIVKNCLSMELLCYCWALFNNDNYIKRVRVALKNEICSQ